jgi:hypothetical protein
MNRLKKEERMRMRERVGVCAALSHSRENKRCSDTRGPGVRQYKIAHDAAILYRRVRAPVH